MKYFAVMCLLMFACKEDYERQLSSQAYILSDSMFIAKAKDFNQMADSLCAARRQAEMPGIIDSILRVRREQINQLRSLE